MRERGYRISEEQSTPPAPLHPAHLWPQAPAGWGGGGVPWPCVQQAPCVLVGTREWRAAFAAEPKQAQSSRPQLHKPPLAPSWARMAAPCRGKSNICQMVLWLLGAVALTVEGLSTALVQPWFPDLPITVHPASSGRSLFTGQRCLPGGQKTSGFQLEPKSRWLLRPQSWPLSPVIYLPQERSLPLRTGEALRT